MIICEKIFEVYLKTMLYVCLLFLLVFSELYFVFYLYSVWQQEFFSVMGQTMKIAALVLMVNIQIMYSSVVYIVFIDVYLTPVKAFIKKRRLNKEYQIYDKRKILKNKN